MSDKAETNNSDAAKPGSSDSAENKNGSETENEVSISIGTVNFHVDKVVIAQIDAVSLAQGLSSLFNMGQGSSVPRVGAAPSRSPRSIEEGDPLRLIGSSEEGDARPSNYGTGLLDDGTSLSI